MFVFFWRDVDDVAADFPEEFAAAIIELIICCGESAEIGKGHGEEALRLEGPEEIASFGVMHDGKQANVFGEIGLAEEIEVVGGGQTQRFIFFSALDIGFDDGFPADNFALNFLFAWKKEFAELIHGER